jgi:hypothetical protein
MKIFFWLLIAVNVIFFGIMKFGVVESGPMGADLVSINENKITLMDDKQTTQLVSASNSLAAPVASVAPAVNCFEWGEFSSADVDQVMTALKRLQLADKLTQRNVDHAIGFWVYIAPLKDRSAVSQKIAQLKARGVTDYFVVQEAGEWFNAISLGLFKTRDAAQSFLDELRSKKVNSAQMGERSGKSKATILMINGLDVQMSEKLTVLKKDFAASELKSVTCH